LISLPTRRSSDLPFLFLQSILDSTSHLSATYHQLFHHHSLQHHSSTAFHHQKFCPEKSEECHFAHIHSAIQGFLNFHPQYKSNLPAHCKPVQRFGHRDEDGTIMLRLPDPP